MCHQSVLKGPCPLHKYYTKTLWSITVQLHSPRKIPVLTLAVLTSYQHKLRFPNQFKYLTKTHEWHLVWKRINLPLKWMVITDKTVERNEKINPILFLQACGTRCKGLTIEGMTHNGCLIITCKAGFMVGAIKEHWPQQPQTIQALWVNFNPSPTRIK